MTIDNSSENGDDDEFDNKNENENVGHLLSVLDKHSLFCRLLSQHRQAPLFSTISNYNGEKTMKIIQQILQCSP